MVAEGTASCSSSNSFGPTSTPSRLTPVILPLGWFKLVTSPICTGSAMVPKTIGMAVVAALAALAAAVAKAAITAGQCPIRRQRRQPVVMVLGPARHDRHIMVFAVANLAEASTK